MKNLKDKNFGWHDIDWQEVNIHVSNLQKDLVVAYIHNDIEKVFQLQEKLNWSWKARALAVRKVTSNTGSKTPGVDNVVWLNHKEKYKAIDLLKQQLSTSISKLKVGLIKRVWIPKTNSLELRPLGIPNIIDRALQELILMSLDPIIEQKSDLHSYGFRKYRGTWDAMTRLRQVLDKPSSPRWVWDVDISDCFNQISHEFIIKELNKVLYSKGTKLVLKWVKAGIIDKGIITLPSKGIPQGGVISPLLCNIVLNGLESVVRKGYLKERRNTVKLQLRNIWVIRYADDFITTSPCKDKLNNEIIPSVKKFLLVRGLLISESKSKIVDLKTDSFIFLGWEISMKKRIFTQSISKNPSILIIKPSKKAVLSLKIKIKNEFHSTNKPFIAIISKLNSLIRGWVNYYSISSHSSKSFRVLHNYIYLTWWIWAQKRHPKRPKKWLVKKYVFVSNKRKWQFGVSKLTHNTIIDPTTCKIRKLRPLKLEINPYLDKDYYLNNPRIFIFNQYKYSVFKRHNFRCFVCKELLLPDEQVDLHHLKPRSEGGTYSPSNIVPVHKTCHDTITYARKDN